MRVGAIQRECNYLQGLEGDIDTSHFGFLHFGAAEPESAQPGTFQYYALKDRAPRYQVVDTEYGSMYTAYRPAEPGTVYHRLALFLFPFWTMIPTGVLGHQVVARGWVPMDDDHTMFFSLTPKVRGVERAVAAGHGAAPQYLRLVRPIPDGLGHHQRLPHRPRVAAHRAGTSRVSPASTPRTRPSPRPWVRSTTAPRSTSAARTR